MVAPDLAWPILLPHTVITALAKHAAYMTVKPACGSLDCVVNLCVSQAAFSSPPSPLHTPKSHAKPCPTLLSCYVLPAGVLCLDITPQRCTAATSAAHDPAAACAWQQLPTGRAAAAQGKPCAAHGRRLGGEATVRFLLFEGIARHHMPAHACELFVLCRKRLP
jgi:hypothetical protein